MCTYYNKEETIKLIGKKVRVEIDRRKGSVHPTHPDVIYGVNYGFVPGTMTGDNEPLDAYVLDDVFGECYEGVVIAVIHRKDDVENKLVVSNRAGKYAAEDIRRFVNFVEKYFDSEIIIK